MNNTEKRSKITSEAGQLSLDLASALFYLANKERWHHGPQQEAEDLVADLLESLAEIGLYYNSKTNPITDESLDEVENAVKDQIQENLDIKPDIKIGQLIPTEEIHDLVVGPDEWISAYEDTDLIVWVPVEGIVRVTRGGAVFFSMPGFIGGYWKDKWGKSHKRDNDVRPIPEDQILVKYVEADGVDGMVGVKREFYEAPQQEDLRKYVEES